MREGVLDAAIVLGKIADQGYRNIKLLSVAPRFIVSQNHPLADEKYLALRDICKYSIAMPLDLRYVYTTLLLKFEEIGLKPVFTQIAPTLSGSRNHLDNEGVFLSVGEAGIASISSNTRILELRDGDRFAFSYYFAYKKDSASSYLTALKNHLLVISQKKQKVWA